MALTLANLSAAAQQAVIDRAANAGVSSPNDIRNILLAYLASTGGGGGGVVNATTPYTLTDADNGKVIFIGKGGGSEAWVYLSESAPPADGFSCSIVAITTDVKVGWDGVSSTLTGPGMANGKWLITDSVNSGEGMGATLVISDSGTLIAHIIGAVELIP